MLRIVTTCWNCEDYIERCLESIKSQSVEDWVCYIIDDLSVDETPQKIKVFADTDGRFVFIQNTEKRFVAGNYYHTLNRPEIRPEDICINVDGDDWLPHNNVFDRVQQIYSDPKVWTSYGSYEIYTERSGVAVGWAALQEDLADARDVNKPWLISHLRTFRVWLFRLIKPEDLIDENGEFYPMAGDLAIMAPVIEMAGHEHSRFVEDILYCYNGLNNLSEHKRPGGEQSNCTWRIKAKEPYKKIQGDPHGKD